MPLPFIHPHAIANNSIHINAGWSSMVVKPPRKKRMPSDESNERTPSPIVADSSHDNSASTTKAKASANAE